MNPGTPKPRLKVRLSPAAEKVVRQGHPWIFRGRLRQPSREGVTGELAVIYDRNDRFLAIGLFDADSPIAIRVLHAGSPVAIDDGWWRDRLRAPLQRRREWLREQTNGYRCINGESEGWPGLVLDRYAGTLVVKLYTAAWFPHLPLIQKLILDEFPGANLILRLSRNIEPAARQANLRDGDALAGAAPTGPVLFQENGIRFEADVVCGQKTGFFLDQRENRQRVGRLANERDVLNVFSHAGGFSLHAAAGGARSCTDLDISQHALDAAGRNFELNRNNPRVAACRHAVIKADAFQWLNEQPAGTFDLIIIDPPSLAKREAEKPGALTAYRKLAAAGVRLLWPGGILVSASCSAHVSADEFFNAIRETVSIANRGARELMTTRQPVDHPATIPEAAYLKCIDFEMPPLNRPRNA